jgi:hypothetical protein
MLIGRRPFLLGLAAVLAFSPAAASPETDPLRRAMRRAGGRKALERVRMLRWEGDATVHAGGRDLAITVSTAVVPFVWARSESWPTAQGREAARTMLITPDGGWAERGGRSEPLPPALVEHERAQFAIYGLMLLAPLLRPPARLTRLPDQDGLARLRAERSPAPPTELWFDSSARLAEARNRVPAPEGGATIPQRFVFSRETMPGPVRWPRELRIEQDGRPYFELRLKRFEAVG